MPTTPTAEELTARRAKITSVSDSMNHFRSIFFNALDQKLDLRGSFDMELVVNDVKLKYSVTPGSVSAADVRSIFTTTVDAAMRMIAWDETDNIPVVALKGTLNGVGLSIEVLPAA